MPLLFLLFFSCLSAETIEEKVGQLFLVHFQGTIGNEDSAKLLNEAKVGGFIYFNWANTLSSPYQVQQLSLSLQKKNHELGSKIPLFIAGDQEGGRVNRFQEGFTLFPSEQIRGNTLNPALEKQVTVSIGEELKAVGVNLVLGPVVDVNSNPMNPVIGNRAYSNDPLEVARFGKAALDGYKDAGIIATLKHFPGHGDTAIDSHSSTPSIEKSIQELQKCELYPFYALSPHAEAVMTAHLKVPALDPLKIATFSHPILTGLLRNQWHYEGIIISDSMCMKGLTQQRGSLEEATLAALLGGCDLICFGGKLLNEPTKDEIKPEDVIRVHRFLVAAVKSGRLPLERLNRSFQRIVNLKQKYALAGWDQIPPLPPEASVSTSAHKALLEELSLIENIQKSLTKEKCLLIGNQIWKNECNGKVEGLVAWNSGEDVLSLGIGHLIWYPENAQKVFDEGFPKYLAFLKRKNIPLPIAIQDATGAPWSSIKEFQDNKNSPLANQLRTWLENTIDLQTEFITSRLLISIDKIVKTAPMKIRRPLIRRIEKLASTPQGLFAMIDYLNFKGDGLLSTERYQGNGWGLYQVLTKMTDDSLEAFQKSAISQLEQRVSFAPYERNENRFLPGWINRINRYSKQ